MTKREIVKTIAEELGLSQLQVREIVQKTFDTIVETLATEGRVELRNFGVFEARKRAARNARNPRTGDSVPIPERWVVSFKPGKEMEQRVQRGQSKPNRASLTQFRPKTTGESPDVPTQFHSSPERNRPDGVGNDSPDPPPTS